MAPSMGGQTVVMQKRPVMYSAERMPVARFCTSCVGCCCRVGRGPRRGGGRRERGLGGGRTAFREANMAEGSPAAASTACTSALHGLVQVGLSQLQVG